MSCQTATTGARVLGCLIAVFALAVLATAEAANEKGEADVREFRVGMKVSDLPAKGYVNFACGHDGLKPEPAIDSWLDYARCPVDAEGLIEVAFQYDDSEILHERYEGTAIASHPVLISLLINDQAVVEGIRILTDPFARPYDKRRARTFEKKAKIRYGEAGWDCVDQPPDKGEGAVGGMFVKQRCTKILTGRILSLSTEFYRIATDAGTEVINQVRLEIRYAPEA